jgi:hypothetical protein
MQIVHPQSTQLLRAANNFPSHSAVTTIASAFTPPKPRLTPLLDLRQYPGQKFVYCHHVNSDQGLHRFQKNKSSLTRNHASLPRRQQGINLVQQSLLIDLAQRFKR